jgi:hypothetical protein
MKSKTTPLPYLFRSVYREINLRNLTAPPYDKPLNPKNDERYTDGAGKYLIDHGFPLIGRGSATLCFLLTEDLVAKVPRYAPGSLPGIECLTQKHWDERIREVAMSTVWPTGWAEIRLMVFVAQGQVYEFFVQERVYPPFIHVGLDDSLIANDPNSFVLRAMLWHNQDAKQFGRTRRKKMWTPIGMDNDTGEPIQVEVEGVFLVGYDFS